VVRARPVGWPDGWLALDLQPPDVIAGKREALGQRDCANAWQRRDALEQSVTESSPRRGVGILRVWQRDAGHDGVRRNKSGVHVLQVDEAADEQTRACEQHHRQCDLGDDERGAGAPANARL
jgi:hypothetical protein